MLLTKPIETRFSMSCQVLSKDILVSISSTPSSPKTLPVVPTPAYTHYRVSVTFFFFSTKKTLLVDSDPIEASQATFG